MAHDVYVSYSSKDKSAADAVCASLEANGIRCWIAPRDLGAGGEWARSIVRAIQECRVMVLVFSAYANESQTVLREVERAVNRGVPIATIRIQDTMPAGGLEYFLSSRVWMNAITPPLERHLREVARHVTAMLGSSGAPVTSASRTGAMAAAAPALGWAGAARRGSWVRRFISLFERAASRGADAIERARAFEEQIFRVLSASSVPEVADAADRLSLPVGATSELPPHAVRLIPRFERAAEHVAKYMVLSMLPLRNDALNAALRELAEIQTDLPSAGRLRDFLLTAANNWRRVLEIERAKVEVQIEASRPIPNPFVVGNPVRETESNLFTGRGDIVRIIEQSLLGTTQAPTLLLYGARRMGKSTILNQLPRLLGPDFAPALVDCQSPAVTGSAATLLLYLTQAISGGLLRRIEVEPLSLADLAQVPYAVFDEWLQNTLREMPPMMRVLLCLDEYERLQATLDAGWGGVVLDFLRHLIQHQPRVMLMLTGVRTFAQMGPAWTDRFISAKRVRVSLLKREEVLPLLTRPVPDFNLTYGRGALEALVDRTNGQPFLTQAVASELVQLLNKRRRHEASPDDVEMAAVGAMESGGEYFANLWTDVGVSGQAILKAVAQGVPPPDALEARATLLENDVLTPEGGFLVPLVRDWVRREKVGRT